jgi:hypothetical protein
MTDTLARIEPGTRAALLIDWIITLIDHLDPGFAQRNPDTVTYLAAIKSRLASKHDAPAPPDLARVHATLTDTSTLTNLHALLLVLSGELELTRTDTRFAWDRLYRWVLPTSAMDHTLPWPLREQARLLDGTYKTVPWAGELPVIEDHYAHMSLTNPEMLAFTETAAKGERDVQTQIKPGRYLARFYPELASHKVRDLSAAIARIVELKFAVTADEIEDVYTRGPSSCMSHEASDYEGHCHPVAVYGDSDLQLAYITDDKDRPIARALVWPAKLRHGRIYGDEALLCQQLIRAGYDKGTFTGARIRRIVNTKDPCSLIMPYIDGIGSFDVLDDTWLSIDGDHAATGTSGITFLEDTATCQQCDHLVPDDRLRDVDGESWCDDCCDGHSFVCEHTDQRYHEHDSCTVIVGRNGDGNVEQIWSIYARDDYATYCDATAEWYADHAFDFVHLENGETWVDWHFEAHGETIDGKQVPKSVQDTQAQQVAA